MTTEKCKISLRQVTDSADMAAAERIYLEAFPPDERRDWAQIAPAVEGLNLLGIYLEERLIGLLTYWRLDDYVYIEHFAVDPALRGGGLGSRALDLFIEMMSPAPILLEAEPTSLSPIAARRVDFYRRHGFAVIDGGYIQPPYSPDKHAVNLWLMSTASDLDDDEIDRLTRHLHRRVYGASGTDVFGGYVD